nr:hypothetical protein Iba_chr11bCG5080 [Ipomoea batatas]
MADAGVYRQPSSRSGTIMNDCHCSFFVLVMPLDRSAIYCSMASSLLMSPRLFQIYHFARAETFRAMG